MTSTGRLKRSLSCATVAVIASTVAVLTRGILANHASSPSSDLGDLQFDLLGAPLAPGWFVTRGMFERSSMNQLLGWACLIPFVSVVIDTGVIFGFWEMVHRLRGVSNNSVSS